MTAFIIICAATGGMVTTLKGSFRTRADSITGSKTRLSRGRKKFNANFIVKTGVFLYN